MAEQTAIVIQQLHGLLPRSVFQNFGGDSGGSSMPDLGKIGF